MRCRRGDCDTPGRCTGNPCRRAARLSSEREGGIKAFLHGLRALAEVMIARSAGRELNVGKAGPGDHHQTKNPAYASAYALCCPFPFFQSRIAWAHNDMVRQRIVAGVPVVCERSLALGLTHRQRRRPDVCTFRSCHNTLPVNSQPVTLRPAHSSQHSMSPSAPRRLTPDCFLAPMNRHVHRCLRQFRTRLKACCAEAKTTTPARRTP